MPTTSNYAFPYPALTDAPNVPADVRALAQAVDTEIARVEADVNTEIAQLDVDMADRLEAGRVAVIQVSITPSAPNTPTFISASWGKTIPGTVVAVATALTTVPGTVVTGVAVSSVTSTGCLVWLTRTSTTATTVNVIAIGL